MDFTDENRDQWEVFQPSYEFPETSGMEQIFDTIQERAFAVPLGYPAAPSNDASFFWEPSGLENCSSLNQYEELEPSSVFPDPSGPDPLSSTVVEDNLVLPEALFANLVAQHRNHGFVWTQPCLQNYSSFDQYEEFVPMLALPGPSTTYPLSGTIEEGNLALTEDILTDPITHESCGSLDWAQLGLENYHLSGVTEAAPIYAPQIHLNDKPSASLSQQPGNHRTPEGVLPPSQEGSSTRKPRVSYCAGCGAQIKLPSKSAWNRMKETLERLYCHDGCTMEVVSDIACLAYHFHAS